MEKVALVNLGCPKNQVDAETMLGLLAGAGYQVTNDLNAAQVIIVNTCGFIDKAKRESVEQIVAVARYKEQGNCRRLVVSGCLAQRYHRDLARELPEVDAFLGTGNVDRIVEVVAENRSLIGRPEAYDGLAEDRRLFSTYPYGYLKIAEGCSNRCAYCVIPRLRGRLRSKPPAQVVREARRMAAGGIREIVLIAQDTSQYGMDFAGESQLPQLLAELEAIPEVEWLRLLYCYPDHIDDRLIEVLAQSPKICRYLDIPLQHSHPDILSRMGRFRRGLEPGQLISRLRREVPGIALRTTFIVGFPGEGEEHFLHLKDFVRQMEFDHVGAFVYSRERGTRAARMNPQVPAREKLHRYRQLMAVQQQGVLKRNQALKGTSFRVLIDRVERGQAVGRSYREAPEIDSVIYVQGEGLEPGQFVRVQCTEAKGYDLCGVKRDE